ncbi:MAG TPA: DUF4192 domain-containing protein [Mycobacteriales bacterium]|nr:DUF4192 domain-containing protein [Mycobacteriales bacterium]
MPKPTPQPVTARLTTPAQMVASMPLWLGYVPTRSLVVACLHEPRGRVGLTLRFDLPPEEVEQDLVEEAVTRVAHQRPTRVLVAVYTDEPDDRRKRARGALVEQLCDELCDALPGLLVTEAVLVRDDRFFSYLCDDVRCCPAEGTAVSAGREDAPVQLLEAEQVLRGQVVLPDRDALARTLSGPRLPAAEEARQGCARAQHRHREERAQGREAWRERWLARWSEAVVGPADGGGRLDTQEAAHLVMTLEDVLLRDALVAEHEPDELLPLLRELMRMTPEPYDAAVCTVFAWTAYCDGGGAEVTIALERALRTDPAYSLAGLLTEVMLGQVPPATVRAVTREASPARAARRRARRSRPSRG